MAHQSLALKRFYDNAAMRATGSIPATLQPELFETIRDFFQFTNIWTLDIAVAAVQDVYDYSVTLDEGVAIKRLMNFYDATDTTRGWLWPATLTLPATITLGRTVSAPTSFVATVSLFPVDPVDANGDPVFPDWVLDNYFDTLFSGMLWRLFSQPAKPWSNSSLAATHYRMYMGGRGRALADVQRGQSFNAQSWTFPSAGITRGRQRGA